MRKLSILRANVCTSLLLCITACVPTTLMPFPQGAVRPGEISITFKEAGADEASKLKNAECSRVMETMKSREPYRSYLRELSAFAKRSALCISECPGRELLVLNSCDSKLALSEIPSGCFRTGAVSLWVYFKKDISIFSGSEDVELDVNGSLSSGNDLCLWYDLINTLKAKFPNASVEALSYYEAQAEAWKKYVFETLRRDGVKRPLPEW